MTVSLDPVQRRNYAAALAVAPNQKQRERLAFAILTESGGRVSANDGRNTSESPGFDEHPEWPGILRRSLSLPHDGIGSNGRSTGILQQTSSDVGGVWGDMAGTMDPATAAERFLRVLVVTNNPLFVGYLETPKGRVPVTIALSSPIAADVLRVQQPLASEARSENYGAANVAKAIELAALFAPNDPPQPTPGFIAGLLKRSN